MEYGFEKPGVAYALELLAISPECVCVYPGLNLNPVP
jgi:hypothetical protein